MPSKCGSYSVESKLKSRRGDSCWSGNVLGAPEGQHCSFEKFKTSVLTRDDSSILDGACASVKGQWTAVFMP
ncbi:hypothetical protein DPMN_158930 [Dreissena polymorpha]|uniref:Uncharacterized protein n=1 Tax=Dreissena polymorpha TaxID=45954 RepID=A0A9D4EJU9_DREPO|nr:hypothetical protein DPMN_158928 [Dreissena polymorpha]KAH3781105.1 hypothetical protein DPMN_158930 [Dreissena polymorpha]